jgi:hypothetical protein
LGPVHRSDKGVRGQSKNRNVNINHAVIAGSFGIALQCTGLIWLLSVLGFPVPWLAILPISMILAGWVFIVRAIIHDRNQIEVEAFSDRRNHSRN